MPTLAAVCSGLLVAACNALFGIDALRYDRSGGAGAGGAEVGGAGGVSCEPGTQQECYEGPPVTEGVGPCRAGTRICRPEGNGYGPCDGQVLPATELCSSPEDEDCSSHSCEVLWAKAFGQLGADSARDVACDAAGDVLLTGYYQGSVAFGAQLLTGLDDSDVNLFAAKIASYGQVLWAQSWGLASLQTGQRIGVDAAGNVLLAGILLGEADFGPVHHDAGGTWDGFVLKLNPGGSQVYARLLTGPDDDVIDGLAVADPGEVALGGTFTTTLDVAGQASLDCGGAGCRGLYVAKLDPAGELVFAQGWLGGTFERVRQVALAPDGDVVMAGVFEQQLDLGGVVLPAGPDRDLFVARLAGASGQTRWAERFGGAGPDEVFGVEVDGQDEILLVGSFNGTLAIGSTDLTGPTASGQEHAFVARLDRDGAPLWAESFGGGTLVRAYDVDLDAGGYALVTGAYQGGADFGTGLLPADGSGYGVFLARLGTDGSCLYAQGFTSSSSQVSAFDPFPAWRSVAVAPQGVAAIAGPLFGAMDFGGETVTSVGDADAAVGLLAP